jgi:flagellar motor protein MotB
MGKKRAEYLFKSLKRTLFAIKPGDKVGIINFDEKVWPLVELSEKREDYILGYNFEYQGGGTDTKKAIDHSINMLQKIDDSSKKILILFSDGGNGFSKNEISEIKQMALRNKVSIYFILYGYFSDDMEEIALLTGGNYYPIFSSRMFPFVFRDIYLSLTSYYKVTYKPPQCEDLHDVRLSFKFPELKHFSIHSRAEYDRSIFTLRDTIGTIAFVNIEFESGESSIKPDSFNDIMKIADALKKNTNIKILIKGHTDDVGSEENNMILSKQRANSVARKLIVSYYFLQNLHHQCDLLSIS